jgi:trk system potassium uptake protein TrkH
MENYNKSFRTIEELYELYKQYPNISTDSRKIEKGDIFFVLPAVPFAIESLDNFEFSGTFTAVAATLNNIGPGLGQVGPMSNFSEFSVLSKCVLMFDMLAGRLEIFPMLLLLVPATWKRQ